MLKNVATATAIAVAILLSVIFAQIIASRAMAATGGLTSDMIRVALSSANIHTAPGSQMRLLDRSTGQWRAFVLDRFNISASGGHATISIDAHEVRQ